MKWDIDCSLLIHFKWFDLLHLINIFLAFDNLMKQKAINQEHYSLQGFSPNYAITAIFYSLLNIHCVTMQHMKKLLKW